MRIVLEAQGGLCNRMRSIDSAIALGQEIGSPITVQWFRNSELNCPLSHLFIFSTDVINVVDVSATGRLGRLRHLMTPYFYRLHQYSYIQQAHINASRHFENLVKKILNSHSIYISTHSRFYAGGVPYRSFILAPTIAERVNHYRSLLNEAVGVHIRRTDNKKSVEAASVEDFVAEMEAEVEQNPEVKFFVATDDPSVLTYLVDRFGETIRFHPKRSYCRNNPLAIEDALVDLYALASCSRLIGSYWSSFTDTAAQLGNIKVKIIGGHGLG